MKQLTGKVAIVTGASKGIGAGIARGLAAAGAKVVVNYASSREGAERVVAEILAADGQAIAVQGDVAKKADVERLFAETKRAFGRVDVLVNNAGVYLFDLLENVKEEDFHRQFATNVLGPIWATREALKYFGSEGGNVINISSVASENATPTAAVYSATKAALDSLTRVLAKELAARKVRVNTIAPGPTETEGLHSAGIGPEHLSFMVEQTPLGRVAKPDDIAKVAVFLASDESGWLTGERLSASGGFH